MGYVSDNDSAATESLRERSIRRLRAILSVVGGAATTSSLADAGSAAKELTNAERRQRQRDREPDDEDDSRKKRDRDDQDEDDTDDRFTVFRAQHAALMERVTNPTRRTAAQQSADDSDEQRSRNTKSDENDAGLDRRRSRQDADRDANNDGNEFAENRTGSIQVPQVVDTDPPETTGGAALRVGSGDTFASVDAETGTAIAESNGVRAISGPDGAFIEGTPGGPPSNGGDNGDDFTS
ncbi:MAG: hypothetical protein M3464_11345 [Chloroflexota bacterium]|nr:hypothetical protein [Chloroflexota bacterium]